MLLAGALEAGRISTAQGATPEELPKALLALDARTPDAGGEVWGGFTRVGAPTVGERLGQKAVLFDGQKDSYERVVPAVLCGSQPRTIEVWAYKESVRGDEETLIAWGRRGGAIGTNLAFNWGDNGGYGGATHWSADMGWKGVPKPGQWHHLVYTYDGTTAKLLRQRRGEKFADRPAEHPANFPLRLAVQNAQNKSPAFKNEYNGSPLSGPVALALVRLYDIALSEAQIAAAFAQDRERFGAVAPLTLARLREGGVETVSAGGLTLTSRNPRTSRSGLRRTASTSYRPIACSRGSARASTTSATCWCARTARWL